MGQPCHPAFPGNGGITEAAETLEQVMGQHNVAEAMRPLLDQTPGSSSSVTGPVTLRMGAEACDNLVREKHSASPPKWKTVSTPRLGVEGGTSTWSPSPLARP